MALSDLAKLSLQDRLNLQKLYQGGVNTPQKQAALRDVAAQIEQQKSSTPTTTIQPTKKPPTTLPAMPATGFGGLIRQGLGQSGWGALDPSSNTQRETPQEETSQTTPQLPAPSANPAYAALYRALEQQRAQLGSERELNLRRMDEDFNRESTTLSKGRDEALEGVRAGMATQGILRSGINIDEQTRVNEEVQQLVDALTRSRSRSVEDVERGYSTGLNQLAVQEQQVRLDEAREAIAAEMQRAYDQARLEALQPAKNQAGQFSPGASPTDIANLFSSMGVPMTRGMSDVSPQARAERIAREVSSGARTLEDVLRSVQMLQQRAV